MHYQHFTVEEREKIQLSLWQKESIRAIARSLNRSPSSISREIKRNSPPDKRYYIPRAAHQRAVAKRKSRGRHLRLKTPDIRSYVIAHLKQGWSPEQISGRLKRDGIGIISHEAIYQFVYVRVSKASDLVYIHQEDLRPYLRFKRKRRARKGLRSPQKCRYVRGLSITQRPAVVAARSRIGDWEGDTVVSKDHHPGLNTLVERKTGLVMITKLSNNTGAATATAVASRLGKVPIKIRHSLTVDNGPENSRWREIEQAVGIQCFFANPYHSWERGTNENTNGLIREYFPKRTDFRMITDEEIAEVEYLLNSRPRKRLGYRTPLEVISVALAG